MGQNYYGFRPYVPVAKRRAQATRELARMVKKGQPPSPVVVQGRRIAHSFWGIAWCDNLESYSDFDNRLPRGRTYVRNGSVVHLEIVRGKILARVSGSTLYTVNIEIDPLAQARWRAFKQRSAGKVGTLVELLQGKLSKAVMELVTDRESGLFPSPKEIKIGCNCPDYAWLCKHAAAVLYGVACRLDAAPEMLFTLRGVDHTELIDHAAGSLPDAVSTGGAPTLSGDLSALFGIEIGDGKVGEERKASGKAPAKKTGGLQRKKAAQTAKPTAVKNAHSPKKPAKPAKPSKSSKPVQSTQGVGRLRLKQVSRVQKAAPAKPAKSVGNKTGGKASKSGGKSLKRQ
jgi:uncharacterized Zn finger protein